MSDNGASAEGGPARLVQRGVLLQLRAREPRGEPPPDRRPRRARREQPLPVGLGVGGQHAAQAVQARHARGGSVRPADRALAAPARAAGRHPAPVRPRHRHHADPARRCSASNRRGSHRRRRPDPDRRRRASRPRSTTRHALAPRTTQYYEMLGSRALYHDGWKAVVFHPPAFMAYDGSDTGRRSFDDDIWELYHVAEDFSEVHDCAGEHPDKLEELQALWWQRGRALPGAAAQQPARPFRRPPVPTRALRVPRRRRVGARGDGAQPPQPARSRSARRCTSPTTATTAASSSATAGTPAGTRSTSPGDGCTTSTTCSARRSRRSAPKWSCRPESSSRAASVHAHGPFPGRHRALVRRRAGGSRAHPDDDAAHLRRRAVFVGAQRMTAVVPRCRASPRFRKASSST